MAYCENSDYRVVVRNSNEIRKGWRISTVPPPIRSSRIVWWMLARWNGLSR